MNTHVAVLMGGWNAEREVSLISGRECADALERTGYRVTRIDAGREIAVQLSSLRDRPDIIFNALHGRYGEDGCVQGLLEVFGIPYTHSGPLASALAMNKTRAKQIFLGNGILCPEGRTATRAEVGQPAGIPRPFVVKPEREGSSVGVRIVPAGENDDRLHVDDFRYGNAVLIESYVAGRELTVTVMDDRALGVTEITTSGGFYDYRNKYTSGRSHHVLPACIHADTTERAMELAVRAHNVLGCRGVTRSDFRYDDTAGEPGDLYLLEVNSQPGMTPLSLVPEQARYAGYSFDELVAWIVENARCEN